ncbi:MAG TPA: winged helix DNA-binding protein [Allosphingosinicella sp.]
MTGNFMHDGYDGVVYRDDPVLLLFGQSEEGLGPVREAARLAGCRIADEAGMAGGAERLDRQVLADAAVVVAETPSAELDALLRRVDDAARAGRMQAIIVAPQAMIDDVTAGGFQDSVTHLVDPSASELVVAMAIASAPRPARLHDVNRRNGVAVLQQLSEEAARIASVLASLSEEETRPGGEGGHREGSEKGEVEASFVRSIIRLRRLREHYFRGELFADPAFDMLLDLYAARLEHSRVAVSSLCIAAAVPATTALRWIKALTDRGLFIRSADPQDGRRVYIELSEEAARAMGRYLAAAQRAGVAAI